MNGWKGCIVIISALLLLVGCTAPEPEGTHELKPTQDLTSALPPSDTPIELPPPEPSDTVTPPTLTQGTTITVTNPSDSDPGSLRRALEIAQDYDTITFDTAVFLIDAPITIPITSELPHIDINNLTLDASDAGVILDGSQVPGEWVAGLQIVHGNENFIRGLRISKFTGPGIAISGDSKNNFIGGDLGQGVGPFGEGNMLTENGQGISLAETGTISNTITGNLIGTGARGGTALGNLGDGISISEGANNNTIGPDNIIAYNLAHGVFIEGFESTGNLLTENSIHDNRGDGIYLVEGGNEFLQAPYILSVDMAGGLVSGVSCPNCTVEIFSTHDESEGTTYEGYAAADSNGSYTFNKGAAFTRDNVTTTAADAKNNTSGFSRPAGFVDIEEVTLQEDNYELGTLLLAKPSSQLKSDPRIGAALFSSNIWNDIPNLKYLINDYTDLGIKRLDTSMQEVEEPIDWERDEFVIFPEFDRFIDDLNENGIAVNYLLHFWDKDGHTSSGGELPFTPRFKTDESIQDFLDYVSFVVKHFRGRIQYYTIWTEPDACGGTNIKCIEPHDYIELARQTIPVIDKYDSKAQLVMTPNVLYFDSDYLFTVLSSDVAKEFDVVSWHGIYDVTPVNDFFGDYYYEYPRIIEKIKLNASTNGFNGDFWGTDLSWCSLEFPGCHDPIGHPWEILETDKLAAKYSARGFVMQIGMDVGVGWGSLENNTQPWSWPTVRNLNTIMAGTQPAKLDVEIDSPVENIASYAFRGPDGEVLFALWTNDAAVEDDPGVNSTLIFRDLDAGKVVGLDVLNGFEQELVTETLNGALYIRDLLVKDYPLIIRLTDTTSP